MNVYALSEVLAKLRADGLDVSSTRIHYAIDNAKVARPTMGRDHRYRFTDANVSELRSYLRERQGVQKATA
jgi:hypothetical protein